MSRPTLSVLMPVYNPGPYLAAAMDSILDQSFVDFEFIVIDDGSTDGSERTLADYARKDGRIRLFRQENRGLIEALNRGIGLAETPLIARMDSDDISLASRFADQVEYLGNHPDCVAVGSHALMIDPQGAPIMLIHTMSDHGDLDRQLLQGRGALPHPGAMMRKDAVTAVGGYQRRFLHAEDVDLFLRLAERGRLHNIPKVLLHYRVHFASVSQMNRNRQVQSAHAAVREAAIRRGIEVPPPPEAPVAPPVTAADHHRRWARWSANAGHLATARKHALRALLAEPFRAISWSTAARVGRETVRGWTAGRGGEAPR